jgi:hypothetical protein
MTTRRPALPQPPKEYNARYFERLMHILTLYFATLDNPGDAVYSSLQLLKLPTSGSNLSPGSLYREGGNIKIVLNNVAYPSGVIGSFSVGNIVVLT